MSDRDPIVRCATLGCGVQRRWRKNQKIEPIDRGPASRRGRSAFAEGLRRDRQECGRGMPRPYELAGWKTRILAYPQLRSILSIGRA